jgi:hypothetical protein
VSGVSKLSAMRILHGHGAAREASVREIVNHANAAKDAGRNSESIAPRPAIDRA